MVTYIRYIHIGEGLPPVPAKLVARIVRHEFVEMHELLLEFWHDQKDGGKTTDKAKAKKRALIIINRKYFSLFLTPQNVTLNFKFF